MPNFTPATGFIPHLVGACLNRIGKVRTFIILGPAQIPGDGRGTVSVSPQEGFLHQTSELDTLGFDRPETKCKLP